MYKEEGCTLWLNLINARVYRAKTPSTFVSAADGTDQRYRV
jgi:hypothetical protein